MNIRNLKPNDAEAFLSLMLRLDNESEFMMYESGERKTNVGEMRARIEGLDSSSGVIFGAFEGDDIVGFISLDRGFANRIKHIGYLVIGVLEVASGRGIGTKLLQRIDRWAEENDIYKLELTVMAHNDKAHSLYIRSGYNDEGIKKKSIRLNGKFYDEYYMGKVL